MNANRKLLTIFGEVLDKVTLRAKLPHELLCHHSPFLCSSEYSCMNLTHPFKLLLLHKDVESKLKIISWIVLHKFIVTVLYSNKTFSESNANLNCEEIKPSNYNKG